VTDFISKIAVQPVLETAVLHIATEKVDARTEFER